MKKHRKSTIILNIFCLLTCNCSPLSNHSDPDGEPGDTFDADTYFCEPATYDCDGQTLRECLEDGSGYEQVMVCDPEEGLFCTPGLSSCSDPCAAAEATDSYVGCEYFTATLLNTELFSHMEVALAIANTSPHRAIITLENNGDEIQRITVEPNMMASMTVPKIPELIQIGTSARSALVQNGAYRLRSNVPITVYQFNPFENSDGGKNQPDPSFTADASLLLPTHVLDDEYIVLNWPSQAAYLAGPTMDFFRVGPAFIAVIAVESATVEFELAADTLGSIDGHVESHLSGSTARYDLEAGDILQLVGSVPIDCEPTVVIDRPEGPYMFCDLAENHDLSGTRITASAPIAVFTGTDCSRVPFYRVACDHLEEMLPPLLSWGKNAVISLAMSHESYESFVRIISGDDDNSIHFDPPVHEDVTLNRGEVLQFSPSESFMVEADSRILAGQFLTGQGFRDVARPASDPGFGLHPPIEQYRRDYLFIAPVGYETNYIGITAPTDTTIELDGEPITDFSAIGQTGFVEARIRISGGVHSITADHPISVMSYGFEQYTSYFYAAGMDIEQLLE